jgi:hypothetical protein
MAGQKKPFKYFIKAAQEKVKGSINCFIFFLYDGLLLIPNF